MPELATKLSLLEIKPSRHKVEFIELGYQEDNSNEFGYKVLTTYPLSNIISYPDDNPIRYSTETFEVSGSEGLNPMSDSQKFPVPRELRRKSRIWWRLRFANKNIAAQVTGIVLPAFVAAAHLCVHVGFWWLKKRTRFQKYKPIDSSRRKS